MKIPAQRFAKDELSGLPEKDREDRLRELEGLLNRELAGSADLPSFQDRLYRLIEDLCALGFSLGPWEYDCEVEIWGGPSYMTPSAEDDLLLRSKYPSGVALAWKDFELLPKE